MKLNIAYPATGCQKLIEIDDEKKLHVFYDKRMSQEVPADGLGEQYAGYVFKITGGNDKQGFPMKQVCWFLFRLLVSSRFVCEPRGSRFFFFFFLIFFFLWLCFFFFFFFFFFFAVAVGAQTRVHVACCYVYFSCVYDFLVISFAPLTLTDFSLAIFLLRLIDRQQQQGVLVNHRVRLLLGKGHTCFRERKAGQRKRKSVRGCIVGPDLAVLSLVIVKKGEAELPGLTDQVMPRRLGPKRATKIRKLFALTKDDDVRKYVVRRKIPAKEEGGKTHERAPKIQRLVTPRRLQRKRRRIAATHERHAQARKNAAEYEKLLKQRLDEQKAKRAQSLAARRKSEAGNSKKKRGGSVKK